MNSDTDRKWIIVRIDGKVAAISTDYRLLSSICSSLATGTGSGKRPDNCVYKEISAKTACLEEVWSLRESLEWEDLHLFGSPFQIQVWRSLFELTHGKKARLISYSDFASLCGKRPGVRAVAHAVGRNPVAVVIPCHLVIPKETIDKLEGIRKKAEATIFKGDDLCLGSLLDDNSIHFGDYAHGRGLKRALIRKELLSE